MACHTATLPLSPPSERQHLACQLLSQDLDQYRPECPTLWIIKVITLHRIIARVPGTALKKQLLWQSHWHRELVHRSIGLGSCMVRRWDAIAGLTAIVTVSVINGTVRVFKGCRKNRPTTQVLCNSSEHFLLLT